MLVPPERHDRDRYLVYCRRLPFEELQLRSVKVGDADGSREAQLLCLHQTLPQRVVACSSIGDWRIVVGARRVDQDKVELPNSEQPERVADVRQRRIRVGSARARDAGRSWHVVASRHFGSDEEGAARFAGSFDHQGEVGLVPVIPCRVDTDATYHNNSGKRKKNPAFYKTLFMHMASSSGRARTSHSPPLPIVGTRDAEKKEKQNAAL